MANLKQKTEEKYAIFSMANLSSAATGVRGAIIWVSVGVFEGKKSEHGPRIKVVEGSTMTANGQSAVITIANTPEFLHGKLKKKIASDAIQFVILNRKVLLDYWNGKIDTSVFIQRLKAIPN